MFVWGSGCSHYQNDSDRLIADWSVGNYIGAANFSQQKVTDSGKTDRVLWLLEEGASMRAAGNLEQSQVVLEEARVLMREYADGPSVSLTNEAGALITNLASLPYRGTTYDRVMVCVYKALNAVQLHRYEDARVEFNRILSEQRDAVQRNAERIEKEQKKLANRESRETAKAEKDKLSSLYVQTPGLEAFANYVNPYATFLEGIYFSYFGVDGSDLERARFSLQRAYDMNPSNPYIAEDLAAANQRVAGKRPSPVTHVIVENGFGPYKKGVRLDLPVFIVSKDVPYVGMNFPSLEFRPDPVHRYQVATQEHLVHTEMLSSMDRIISAEFNQELPLVITKTIVAATAKAAAQYALREATKNAGLMGALVQVGGVIYQVAMNEADLRIWSTLPKEVLYTRVPTPENGVIRIAPAGMLSAEAGLSIQVTPGKSNIVYLRIPTSYTSSYISVIPLP
jgi:hypothetical protein